MNFYATICLATFIWICVPAVKGSPHSLGILFVCSSQHNSTEALDGALDQTLTLSRVAFIVYVPNIVLYFKLLCIFSTGL